MWNLVRVEAEWILVLKFELCSRARSSGRTVFSEKMTSCPVSDWFSRIFASATHEFQAIFGLLLSKLSIMIIKRESTVTGYF